MCHFYLQLLLFKLTLVFGQTEYDAQMQVIEDTISLFQKPNLFIPAAGPCMNNYLYKRTF